METAAKNSTLILATIALVAFAFLAGNGPKNPAPTTRAQTTNERTAR